jgi:luciferase family oxidoreductase group 1
MTELRLNILDQCPLVEGGSPAESLRNMVDLAVLGDRLGYSRFWIAEHHGSASKACASPEVLLGPLAAATSRIRVGSGGVMLQHYSAFKVFESFFTLSQLYPGRIDLGIGRAAGGSAAMKKALQRDRRHAPLDDFDEQLTELLLHFDKASMNPTDKPELWLLGTSKASALLAMRSGISYAFADFLVPNGAELLRSPQDNPPEQRPPVAAVSVWALCAESAAEAQRLASSFRMMKSAMFADHPIAVPAPDKALRFLNAGGPLAQNASPNQRIIVGTPDIVRDSILSIAQEFHAGEVFVLNSTHDHGARCRSYELLWEACKGFG